MPKNIKKPKCLPKVIAKDDHIIISSHLKKTKPELWRIYQFALYTATRREEIHDVDWKNFTPKQHELLAGSLRIIGKGKKERTIPILKQAFFAMGPFKKKGRVFKQWTVDTYTRYFHDECKSCGIDAHLHMTRHTSATQMLEDGISLHVIQKILGHSDIKTTMIYAHVFDKTVENEITKLSYKNRPRWPL